MINGQQSLASCISVIRALHLEAEQRFGLRGGERQHTASLMRSVLNQRSPGTNEPLYAVTRLHRSDTEPWAFTLRCGERKNRLVFEARIDWNKEHYQVTLREYPLADNENFKWLVSQMRNYAERLLDGSLEVPSPPVYTSIQAAILI